MISLQGKTWYRWVILVVCILVYFCGNVVRWNYTGVSSYLTGEWGIGKKELGVLGSVFFYTYALGQSPWGSLTDIFGGRKVIGVGILLTSVAFGAFALTNSYGQALVARGAMGIVAGAGFVTCLSVLSRWFPQKERALAFSLFSGTGGGLGEVSSFLIMPLISLFMVGGATFMGLGSWRASTMVMAVLVFCIAMLAFLLLRAQPADIGLPSIQSQEDKSKNAIDYKTVLLSAIKEPWFWIITVVWQGFTVSLRLVPGWLAIYAAAYYKQTQGLSVEAAMVAGGGIGSIYVAGRIFGTPIAGKVSDILRTKYNIPRSAITAAILALVFSCEFLLTQKMPSPVVFAVLAFAAGVFINMFSLVNATVTEVWSIKTSGVLMGVVNTVGQFMGANALALSGFMAAHFSVKDGGYWLEYRGIWYLAMLFSGLGVIAAIATVFREKRSITEDQ